MPREVKVTQPSAIRTSNKIHTGAAIHGSGTVVRAYKTLRPRLPMCSGCRDNYYNSGASTTGRCWMFDEAVVVDKVGYEHINVANGPNVRMKKTLDCWHAVRK